LTAILSRRGAETQRENIFLPQSPQKCAKLKTIIKLFFALFAFFAAKDILKFSPRLCVSAVDHPPFKRRRALATALPLVPRPYF